MVWDIFDSRLKLYISDYLIRNKSISSNFSNIIKCDNINKNMIITPTFNINI